MSITRSHSASLAICVGMIVLGSLIAVVFGFGASAVGGGLVAAAGALPAAHAAWRGMQRQSQAPLATSLGAMMLALGIGLALVVIGLITVG